MLEAIFGLLILGLLFVEIMVWIDEKHSFIWSIIKDLSGAEEDEDKYKDINKKFKDRMDREKDQKLHKLKS